MDDERDTAPAGSLAGLSAADEASSGRALGVAGGSRYHELEVVGEGGLGTVMRAHDRFLGREVALKRIGPRARSGSPAEVHDRFLHEARVTARLDHPGIVPVHDAGVTDDGRMFYTMRLIRGRSLEELAGAATSFEARFALLGPITAACHAIGYAHRQGVIHRDLKPANIMVGALGETQVVDWGLAQILAEREPRTGFAGTFPYASPEVLRGEPHDIAADVWALGVTLHEVLTGEHRFGGSRSEVEAAVTRSPLPPARWPRECPAELVAIGERAMAASASARYADAYELARDLDAFRDGRRVEAHRYSRLELLRRFAVAWRWPLAATATLALGTIGALALTNHRTENQRRRAVAAEAATRTELQRAEASLAETLARRAVSSLEQGAIADAELAAVEALEHGEHPDARGVLAATRIAPHPTLLGHVSIPSCSRVVATGRSTALCLEHERVVAWNVAPLRQLWERPLQLDNAAVVGESLVGWTAAGEIIVLASDTGVERARAALASHVVGVQRALTGERIVLHDRLGVIAVGANGATVVTEHACPANAAIDAAATTDTTTWVICAGGALGSIGERGFSLVKATGFGTEVSAARALALSESGHDVAIGNTSGTIMLIDLRGCMSAGCENGEHLVTFNGIDNTGIRALAPLGGFELVAIDEWGTAFQRRHDSFADLTRLPLDRSTPPLFLEGGELVAGGSRFMHYRIDSTALPTVLRHYHGIVSAAISADRTLAATLADDSELILWDLTTGVRRNWQQVVDARALELSPDGARVRVTHGAGTIVIATDTGAILDRTASPPAPDVIDPAIESPHRVVSNGLTVDIPDADITRIARSSDERYLAIATSAGRIELWDTQRQELVAQLRGHIQRVTWLAFDRDRLWSAGLDGRLRSWSLAPLAADAATLTRDVRAAWGAQSR